MSESMTESIKIPTPADIAPKAPAQEPEADAPEKVETDWRAAARKWEAQARANKSAADELARIKAATQTEAERAAEALATAQREAASARRDALRFRVAAKFGITDEDADLLLTGDDEAVMTRQAEALAARRQDANKAAQVVPGEGSPTQPMALNGDGLEQALRTKLGIA